MKITIELPDNILALHVVAVTSVTWPNIALVNLSVPSKKLFDGSEIKLTDVCETKKED